MRSIIVAGSFDKLIPFSFLCFEAYWSKGTDISELDTLTEMAESIGIDKEEFIRKSNTQGHQRST